MKILILSNKLPYPPRDGGSIATLNMITGLNKAGNQITCLSLNTNKHPFPVKEIPEELAKDIRFMGVHCNSSIRPLPLLFNLFFSKKPYIALRFNVKAFRSRLADLLEKESFDIIQLEGPYPALYLDLIRWKSQARVSLRAHNVEHLIWARKALQEKSPLRKGYLNNMAKRLKHFELEVAQGVDALIPISDWDADYFTKQGVKKPTISIPAGLYLDSYLPTELPREASIFFIGALDWLPNQEGLNWFLQKVFNGLLTQLPDLKFHVAGRNAPKHFEKKLKHPNIVYHGEVDDAMKFIQSHRIMVAPLLTGSGIRVKILEGMALGRPVVTTSRGMEGIPPFSHPHLLVEDDPSLFCARVLKLLSEKQESKPLQDEAREFIGRYFDTFELSRRLSQFYKDRE